MTELLSVVDEKLSEFVASVELARPGSSTTAAPTPSLATRKLGEPAGYAVNGSLLGFSGPMSDLHESDVLCSSLFARLVANKKYDRSSNPDKWFQCVVETMSTIGWALTQMDSKRAASDGSALTAKHLVERAFQGDDQAILDKCASELEDAARSHRFPGTSNRLWFNVPASPFASWNLQLYAAKSRDGAPEIRIVSASWIASPQVQGYLSFSFVALPAMLTTATCSMRLDEEIYGRVREAIKQKLGKAIAEDITRLI